MPSKVTFALAALAVTAIGVGALTTIASADEGGQGWRGRHGGMMQNFMERYDANKDGKVSQEEIDVNRTEWFGKFDSDKNGNLTLKEFEALWLEAHRKEMVREFQKLDPNGDAVIIIEEYKEPLSRFVANRDRNGDGVYSKDDRREDGKERWRRDRDRDDDKDGSKQEQ